MGLATACASFIAIFSFNFSLPSKHLGRINLACPSPFERSMNVRLFCVLGLAVFCFSTMASPEYQVQAPGIRLEFSTNGEITSIALGPQSLAVHGSTQHLVGCRADGPVTIHKLDDGGIEFTRVASRDAQRQCTITERFTPTANSVRWEVQIHSDGEDWSAPIMTTLTWPTPDKALTWAAWQDPRASKADKYDMTNWHDPLVPQPFRNKVWSYGEAFDGNWKDRRYRAGNIITLPMFSILDPEHDEGLTLVQCSRRRMCSWTWISGLPPTDK